MFPATKVQIRPAATALHHPTHGKQAQRHARARLGNARLRKACYGPIEICLSADARFRGADLLNIKIAPGRRIRPVSG